MTAEDFNTSVVNQMSLLKQAALYFTKNQQDANDLMQDTVYRAFVSRNNFSEYTNLGAWLYTIMKNLFINRYRYNKKRGNKIEISDYLVSIQKKYAVMNLGDSNIELEYLNKELKKLDKVYHEPFMLYYSGYKYHEIAQKLGLPIGTIKSRIFLARKELKRRLRKNSGYQLGS